MRELIKLPANYYIDLITFNKPFSLSRFGDGEVLMMFNHEFFKNKGYGDWIYESGDALKKIFYNNLPYFHCYLDCTFWNHPPHKGEHFSNFLNEICPNIKLYRGEIWQDLSFTGNIEKLSNAINSHRTVFIGGKHLHKISLLNGITEKFEFIEVDDFNAYDEKIVVFEKILNFVKEGYNFFAFSASIMTKVLIDELYPLIGDTCFLIDFGSVFDPYCNILSRFGMKFYGYEKFQPYTRFKLG